MSLGSTFFQRLIATWKACPPLPGIALVARSGFEATGFGAGTMETVRLPKQPHPKCD
ncbi:hypothetical protein [Nisaea sp.]|uniref:hypothetical protein n=1 Tax=Nisaea sp. TaxID=2024842 RepID=UPI003298378F